MSSNVKIDLITYDSKRDAHILVVVEQGPWEEATTDEWLFFFGGLGYSALLAFFAIGLCLLPRPMRPRVFKALFSVQVFAVFLMAAICCIAIFHLPLSLISILTRPTLWALYPFGAAMLGFACYGWYFHLTHDAVKVA